MRHLKTLGVGPSDLITPISTNITALTDCPIRYRSLAFPSAADLFDVQSSFNHMIVNNIQLNKFVELTLNSVSSMTRFILPALRFIRNLRTCFCLVCRIFACTSLLSVIVKKHDGVFAKECDGNKFARGHYNHEEID